MNKKDVKSILISMRTPENEAKVNFLLSKIDIMDEARIEQISMQMGNDEQSIRKLLSEKIGKRQLRQGEEKYPINNMFTYGISGNCVHLHLPGSLQENFETMGIRKTIDLVNLHLLDAIDKIKRLKDDGFYRFSDIESIYMISPIMIKAEMRFLEGLDFNTNSYSKKQLADLDFISNNPEAQLARRIFGDNRNVGSASISFDTINSKEWQSKKRKVLDELQSKVIDEMLREDK